MRSLRATLASFTLSRSLVFEMTEINKKILNYFLYNFELIPESKLQIQVSNRAFQYNDGVFETMLFVDGKVRFLEDHLSRLQKAANVLQIELPETLLEPETVAFWVEKLIAENQVS